MTPKLISKDDAVIYISQMAQAERPLLLHVTEDICFEVGAWVEIGNVSLFPETSESGPDEAYSTEAALRFGGYEWDIPNEDVLKARVAAATGQANPEIHDRLFKSFAMGIQDVLRRCLLLYPVFDFASVGVTPPTKPVTIVADTNAVHQGALDFMSRFFNPWARIKIPAIVHMEIVEQADNYLKGIRHNAKAWEHNTIRPPGSNSGKLMANYRPRALDRHLLSQGGQRTLMRLELDPDTEIERGDLGADPIRGIIQPSSDQEDKNLAQTTVVKSFADRLILETARRFQAESRPSHPITIATSDQGMARMAVAEGMGVCFFHARSAPKFTDLVVTGTRFHPFKRELHWIPFANVLWELAAAFGGAKVTNQDGDQSLEIWALGGYPQVSWQPSHAFSDLMWSVSDITSTLHSSTSLMAQPTASFVTSVDGFESAIDRQLYDQGLPVSGALPDDRESSESEDAVEEVEEIEESNHELRGYYNVSPQKLLDLVGILIERRSISHLELQKSLSIKDHGHYRSFINFLRSGDFVTSSNKSVTSNESLIGFWQSVESLDIASFQEYLRRVPSFAEMYGEITEKRLVRSRKEGLSVSQRAETTYNVLGSASGAWLYIPEIGYVATDAEISVEQFSEIAMTTYEQLAAETEADLVLTGKWLERLATNYAIGPRSARSLLTGASQSGQLEYSVEGSTPDTRFDTHTTYLLERNLNSPIINKSYLYRGGFLLPGVSSVRINLRGISNAT